MRPKVDSEAMTTRYGIYMADLSREQTDSQGIITYSIELARSLPQFLAEDEELIIYANEKVVKEIDLSSSPQVVVRSSPVPGSPLARLWLDHVSVTRWSDMDDLDLVHFPKGWLPRMRQARRTIVTIHDDLPVLYAEGQWGRQKKTLKVRYFANTLRHSLRRADRVLAPSEFTKKRLVALGASPQKIEVTYQGISSPDRTIQPKELPGQMPYLLHFGSSHPHKRSVEVVQLAMRYINERNIDCSMVVAGAFPEEAIRSQGETTVVRISRVLDSAEHAGLVAGADVVLVGSEYEGFGRPPVEAFCWGSRAVYALNGAAAEVLDGVPGAFRAGSYESFASALDASRALGADAAARIGQRLAEKYSWAVVASRTIQAYRSTAHQDPTNAAWVAEP